MSRHPVTGIRPVPLASYLAGLGLVRVLGEQADPSVTAAWSPDGLIVDTTVEDLTGWLAEHYRPTPVLSPWNEGSGFGAKDKTPRQVLADLSAIADPRLDDFRAALAVANRIGAEAREHGWDKQRAVRELRNQCPEPLLAWIDAAVVLASDQTYFPPLLGTGGNDGRLDFSTTFHRRLLTLLDPDPKSRRNADRLARDLLEGQQTGKLDRVTVGQFDPAGAGGKGSSPFGDADSLANPWGFVLLVEGAMLFAASAARRHQHAAGRAAIPFTVLASPDGSDSGAEGESATSRGEVWAPLWEGQFTLPEIRQLFAEARASWRGRPAQRAVEFYAATRTLGVARGVAGFQRYGLHRRNGLAYVAVPVERVRVRDQPAVRLAAGFEDWVSRVRRGESSTAVGRAVRRFDTAQMRFVRSGEPEDLRGLLVAVTDLEQAVGRSRNARDSVPVRNPPPAGGFLSELSAVETPELRVAAGIASLATRPGATPARSTRHLLLPIDPDWRWRDSPLVAGFGLRPLYEVLADVLAWRCRTAADEPAEVPFRGAPTFRDGLRVPAADLHALAAGQLDSVAFDRWLRAFLALRWDGTRHGWRNSGGADWSPPVTVLGLLHPFAVGLPTALVRPEDRNRSDQPAVPRLGLRPDWAARLRAGRVDEVHADAVRVLRGAGWYAPPPAAPTDVDGVRVAAALLPRCDRPQRALASLLATRVTTADPETDASTDTEPDDDPRELLDENAERQTA